MKFLSLFAAACFGVSLGVAQQPSSHPAQTPGQAPSQSPQVLFSGPPKSPAGNSPAPAVKVTDAGRTAVVITAWNLDVHLAPRQQSMEVHARVTLRNDSSAPLSQIPLQLSSSLNFETIGLRGQRLPFARNTIPSDADHTGQLHEAVATLAEPLAPRSALTLDVDYGGAIPLTAQRLMAIGAPEATAQASDWDRISADFTGLRGFGNVVWYPVSSVPVSLGEGAKLFTEIGRQKLLDQDANVTLRVTDEFLSDPPTAAILDGRFVALDKPSTMPTASFPGVITVSLPTTRLGFETPSLFLARRTETDSNGLRVLATDAGAANVQAYISAAAQVQPFVRTWLGAKSRDLFTILELPEPDDAPAETGALLATPLASADPAQLAPVIAHGLAHAAFSSPRGWLNEGVASFLGTLWIESSQGRTAALESLNNDRAALALAEPGTPGQGPGEDLLHAVSAVYYRTKANYVLWMLRDIAGDKPLQSALQTYNPAQDTTPAYFQRLVEQAVNAERSTTLAQPTPKDLSWFFENWVTSDHGLPDLSIAGVFPSAVAHQQVLIAIEIGNDGYAEAEVPLTVKGVDTSVTQRVRVPAHGHTTYRITFQEDPTEIDVNDGTVPEVQDSIHQKLLTKQP